MNVYCLVFSDRSSFPKEFEPGRTYFGEGYAAKDEDDIHARRRTSVLYEVMPDLHWVETRFRTMPY